MLEKKEKKSLLVFFMIIKYKNIYSIFLKKRIIYDLTILSSKSIFRKTVVKLLAPFSFSIGSKSALIYKNNVVLSEA